MAAVRFVAILTPSDQVRKAPRREYDIAPQHAHPPCIYDPPARAGRTALVKLMAWDQGTVRLDLPPFTIHPDLDAAAVGQAFSACFQTLAGHPDRLSRSYATLIELIGQPSDDPLRNASVQLAQDLDAGIGTSPDAHYHNAQHVCEVLLSAHYIGLLAQLGAQEHRQLLLAALIHDYDHDGSVNGPRQFHLERHSVRVVQAHLDANAVTAAIRPRLAAMILTTEIALGLPYTRSWYRHHYQGEPVPVRPAPAAELKILSDDPEGSRLAIALAEADALASAGLGRDYADLQLSRLAHEWNRPLHPKDLLSYLENGFGEFLLATFFTPNLERMKATLRAP